jgi:hypothetical protein
MTIRDVLIFAIGWGAATQFWLALWLASEWADNDFLVCFLLGLGGSAVTDEQYITLLAALGDIQSAVDALGLDVERLLVASDLDPVQGDYLQPPAWFSQGRCAPRG